MVLSLLAVFASCKKDKEAKPEDNFDPTKYYITGEGADKGADNYSTSYAIILKPKAMGYFTAWGGSYEGSFNYKYENGTLKCDDIGVAFTIVNNAITATSNPQYKSFHLQKIPDADAFAGKTFRGTVAKNGVNNGVSCQIQYTTNGKFILQIDGFLQTVAAGDDYTLQNNGIATANTGNEGRLHLMTIADGKLYYSQNIGNTKYYGILPLK